MAGGTFREPSGPVPESVYWRRRVVVGAAVLLVIGLLAWSCGGSGGAAGQQDDGRRPAAAGASASPPPESAASPNVGATVTVAATTEPPASRSPSSSAEDSSGDSQQKKPKQNRKKKGRFCQGDDLRIALHADAKAYGKGDRPRLRVLVTSGRSCVADVGPKRLQITITSGADRIWSSADCARGRGDTTRRISPHRPYLRKITWHRVRSDPDECGEGSTRVRARPGWYVAVAILGKHRSQKAVFQLTG